MMLYDVAQGDKGRSPLGRSCTIRLHSRDLPPPRRTFHVRLQSPLAHSHSRTDRLRLAATRVLQSGLTARAVMGSESCQAHTEGTQMQSSHGELRRSPGLHGISERFHPCQGLGSTSRSNCCSAGCLFKNHHQTVQMPCWLLQCCTGGA
jgi:hypothetical protein